MTFYKVISNITQKNKLSTIIGIPVLLIAITTLIYSPVIFGFKTFYTGLDNIDQFYTWYQTLAKSLSQGHLPLWSNNALGGKSFIGELQPGVLYPLNLLWIYLFDSSGSISRYALEMLAVFHGFIGLSGMYLLARRLKMSIIASLGAGIIYAFSGPVLARSIGQISIYYGLTWIPLGISMLIGALQSKKNNNVAILSVITGSVAGLTVLSGHMQPFLHLAMILFPIWAYSAYSKKTYIHHIKVALMILVGFIIVAGFQLYASNQWFGESYRILNDGYKLAGDKVPIGSFLRAFIVDPRDLQNYFIPGFIKETNTLYIGITSWVFVGMAYLAYIFSTKYQSKKSNVVLGVESKIIIAIGVVGLLVAMGYHLYVASIFYFIPIVGSSIRSLARYSILPHVALSIIVAYCIDYIATHRQVIYKSLPLKNIYIIAIAILVLLQGIYVILIPDYLMDFSYKAQIFIACLTVIAALVIIKSRMQQSVFGGVILISLIGTSFFNVQYYTKDYNLESSPEYIYKSTKITDYLESVYMNGYRTMILDSATPQNIGYVYNISTVEGYGATIYQDYLDFIGHNKKDVGVSFDPYGETADIFGVRYVISKRDLSLRLITNDGNVKLFERDTAYGKIQRVIDSTKTKPCKYTIIEMSSNSQEYNIQVDESGYYMVNDFAAKGWVAEVNGVQVPIEKFGYGSEIKPFRMVYLEKGSVNLEFRYNPLTK